MGLTRDAYAIVGLGVTKQGRVPGVSDIDMKTEGLRLAIEDAGLKPSDIDGYIYQPGMIDMGSFGNGGEAPKNLGMNPKFIWQIQSGGASAIAAIMAACAAIDSGMANYVAIGYGDTALSGSVLVGEAGQLGAAQRDTPGAYGMYSPGADHALAAQRHMHLFGTTKEQLGAIAVTQREYAQMRPDAYMNGRPMTIEDYLNARPIASPLGKYDYCLVADGGCALIITSADRAKDHPKPPVYISGHGFSHSVGAGYTRTQYQELGVQRAKQQAFGMAGISLEDIDVAQIYDCFTITVLLTLEDYGFCKKGEGGPFVAEGNTRLDGRIPTNTAGGELSWSYMQGFTPLVEGVRQMRNESGATQVQDAEIALVTGHGGTTKGIGQMEYAEACLVLRKG
mgnify:CR=1 FL=1